MPFQAFSTGFYYYSPVGLFSGIYGTLRVKQWGCGQFFFMKLSTFLSQVYSNTTGYFFGQKRILKIYPNLALDPLTLKLNEFLEWACKEKQKGEKRKRNPPQTEEEPHKKVCEEDLISWSSSEESGYVSKDSNLFAQINEQNNLKRIFLK